MLSHTRIEKPQTRELAQVQVYITREFLDDLNELSFEGPSWVMATRADGLRISIYFPEALEADERVYARVSQHEFNGRLQRRLSLVPKSAARHHPEHAPTVSCEELLGRVDRWIQTGVWDQGAPNGGE
jgi:hypothetical protein